MITKDGYVLTNLHVINKLVSQNEQQGIEANAKVDIDGVSIFGIIERGKKYLNGNNKFVLFEMTPIAYDQKGDLALLEFNNNFKTFTNNQSMPIFRV